MINAEKPSQGHKKTCATTNFYILNLQRKKNVKT